MTTTTPAPPGRARYGDVLRVREYRVLLAAEGVSVLGTSLSVVALAVLVFQRSGSPLLSALTFTLGFTPYLLGGLLAGRLVDRLPARTTMVLCDLLRAAAFGLMALPGVPLPLLLVLVAAAAVVAPLFSGASGPLLPQLLGEGPPYVVGRSLLRITGQLQQVVAVALSAALLLVLPARELLVLDAASFLVSALVLRLGLATRRAVPRPPSGDRAGLRPVLADPVRRRLLLLGWLVPGFAVAPEALATPYVAQLGLPADRAGLLLWTVPAGVVLGELLVVRLVPAARWPAWALPLAGLALAAPLLLLARPGLLLAGTVLAAGGAGFAYSLGLDAQLLAATPEHLRARTYATAGGGMMFSQGLGFALAGAVGQVLPAAQAVPVVTGAGLVLLLSLVRTGRRR